MSQESTHALSARPRFVVFIDGVHAHVRPRRVRRLRRSLRALGIRSTLERPPEGAGQLVCFTLAGFEGLWLGSVVHALQEHGATVVRLEIAADALGVDPDRAEAIALGTLRLKRDPGEAPTHAVGQRVSYVGTRRDPIALAIYADRACKRISRSARTCHVELRIQRPVQPGELLNLDPAFPSGRAQALRILERETTWSRFMAYVPRARVRAHA